MLAHGRTRAVQEGGKIGRRHVGDDVLDPFKILRRGGRDTDVSLVVEIVPVLGRSDVKGSSFLLSEGQQHFAVEDLPGRLELEIFQGVEGLVPGTEHFEDSGQVVDVALEESVGSTERVNREVMNDQVPDLNGRIAGVDVVTELSRELDSLIVCHDEPELSSSIV